MIKKILIGLLVVFVIAQFFQPKRNEGAQQTAGDFNTVVVVPDTIMNLLKTACFDCHSNNTKYPWYSNITPVNWWLKNHVDEGKRGLNFNNFATYSFKKQDHKLEEIAETVSEHAMPLESYLWLHKEARLDDNQRKLIVDWANETRKQVMADSLAGR